MRALVILQNSARVIGVFGGPLHLRHDQPLDRLTQARFERMSQEGLRIADEADVGCANAQLLPQQPHQPVGLGAAGAIAVAAGGQQQPYAPRRN